MKVNQVLNESIDIDEATMNAVIEYMMNDMDWSGGDGETFLDDYIHEYELVDGEGDELTANEVDENTPEFKEWIRLKLEYAIDDAIRTIERGYEINNGKIVLWREIRAERKFLTVISNRGLGIYWSWDEYATEAHWAGNGSPVLMKSEASFDQIDWAATLAHNASMSMIEEREIRIKEDEHLYLTGLFVKDIEYGSEWKSLGISKIKGKPFPV